MMGVEVLFMVHNFMYICSGDINDPLLDRIGLWLSDDDTYDDLIVIVKVIERSMSANITLMCSSSW